MRYPGICRWYRRASAALAVGKYRATFADWCISVAREFKTHVTGAAVFTLSSVFQSQLT
jgi:hypothetical protein